MHAAAYAGPRFAYRQLPAGHQDMQYFEFGFARIDKWLAIKSGLAGMDGDGAYH